MSDNRPIGVFDSGVGGLTVLHELRCVLPHEHFIYLGDTARVPYGTKSAASIQRYTLEAAQYLLAQDIKLLVVACNSVVSTNVLPILEARYPGLPIIGVIEPGALAAVQASKNQQIGVLATRATLQSGAYPQAIQQYSAKAQVFIYAAPLLVPLAEEAWLSGEITANILNHYLQSVLNHEIDCLLLGCTHYPLFVPQIKQLLPAHVSLVDSAITTAQATAARLHTLDYRTSNTASGILRFYVTDDPSQFAHVGSVFLGQEIVPETVQLTGL